MMLVLANIYDIPELNIGFHFYMKSDDDDSERVRLRTSSDEGVKYTKQVGILYKYAFLYDVNTILFFQG